MNRREFISSSAIVGASVLGLGSVGFVEVGQKGAAKKITHKSNPIAISTYSFWRFKDGLKLPIEQCIE